MKLYFLGGVHGVGKSLLAQSVASELQLTVLSASNLIREQGLTPSTADKRVADIQGNQERLLLALDRYRSSGATVLLDGHYCLRSAGGAPTALPVDVFRRMGSSGLLLLVDEPSVIAVRLRTRDMEEHDVAGIAALQQCEEDCAVRLASQLSMPLRVVRPPSAASDAGLFLRSLMP